LLAPIVRHTENIPQSPIVTNGLAVFLLAFLLFSHHLLCPQYSIFWPWIIWGLIRVYILWETSCTERRI